MDDVKNQGQKDSEMIREAVATPEPRESGSDVILDVAPPKDRSEVMDLMAKLTGARQAAEELRTRLTESEAALSTQQAEVERVRLAGKNAALALDHAVAILDRLGILFEIARDNMLFALTTTPTPPKEPPNAA